MNTLRLHSKLKKIVFLIYTFVREDKKKSVINLILCGKNV